MRDNLKALVVLSLMCIVGLGISHGVNSAVEKLSSRHPVAVDVLHTLHLMDFLTTGGGHLGTVENTFAREWGLAVMAEDRTLLQKIIAPRWLTFQPLGYWVKPEKTWHHPGLQLKR